MVAGDGQRRIVKCIRLDEGSVEIDAEHGRGGGVGCDVRGGQTVSFLQFMRVAIEQQGVAGVLAPVDEEVETFARQPTSLSSILRYLR